MDQPAGLRAAAQMVASELLENAIKYGEAVPAAPQINFVFRSDERRMTIIVSNGLHSELNYERLRSHVEALAAAEDPAAVYVARLQELMDNPTQESAGLGIYRIGLEGGFALECRYQDRVVSVTATRSIS